LAPAFLARGGVETKNASFLVGVADAAAAINAAADDQRAGVHMKTLALVPDDFAVGRVNAIEAVVAGPEVDLAARDARRRLGMASRLHLPELFARDGVEAKELTSGMLMKALAYIDFAVGDAR